MENKQKQPVKFKYRIKREARRIYRQITGITGVVKRLLIKLYLFIFARPSNQKFNDALLSLALRARGYNNHPGTLSHTLKMTGELGFLKKLAMCNPALCIDVGANVGEYTQEILERTKARVISFEPLPKAYEKLSKLKEKYPDRLETHNVGVGSKEEKLQLYYGAEDSVLATFSNEVNKIEYVGSSNTNVMEVDVITLDQFYELNLKGKYDTIDLLKIDTEGFEYEVLSGAQKTIKDLRPKFIQIEYNWHQLFRSQSLLKLSELMDGYKAYQLLPYGDCLAYREVKEPETNIYQYSNFVFIRDDVVKEVISKK